MNATDTSNKVRKAPLMAHLVLGFPDLAKSEATAAQYVASGVEILELQIPFSHPTADGPVITAACREAVEGQKVGMAESLAAVARLRERFPEQEIMVMSYLNPVYAWGLADFARDLLRIGVERAIIPDLPADSPEAASLQAHGLRLTPVLAANTTPQRLERLMSMGFDFYYLMSDFSITGGQFSLHPNLHRMIDRLRANAKARIGIGFGISNGEHVRLITRTADYAIVGSALIQAQITGSLEDKLAELLDAC